MNIFIWALLNFIGIVIENIGTSIGKSKQYYKMQNTHLSSKNTKRLHCILASPLLAMSAISNFYFLGGQDIGNIFIQKIIHGKFIIFILVFYFLYAAFYLLYIERLYICYLIFYKYCILIIFIKIYTYYFLLLKISIFLIFSNLKYNSCIINKPRLR